jgi:hypothetical protein
MRTRGNELLARVPRRSGGEGLFRVPRLEELVADPDRIRVLDAHTTCILRMRAIAALNLLNAHDMELLWRERGTVLERRGERLLRVKEAAKKFWSPRIGFTAITRSLASQCGTAGYCGFRSSESSSTSESDVVEIASAESLTRRPPLKH